MKLSEISEEPKKILKKIKLLSFYFSNGVLQVYILTPLKQKNLIKYIKNTKVLRKQLYQRH